MPSLNRKWTLHQLVSWSLGKIPARMDKFNQIAKGRDRWCLLKSVVSSFTHFVWNTVLSPPQLWTHTHTHLKILSSNLLSTHKNKDLCEHILVLNVWQEFHYSVTISQLVVIMLIEKVSWEMQYLKSGFAWILYYTYFQNCTLTNCITYLFQWNMKNLRLNRPRDQKRCTGHILGTLR